MDLTNRYSKSGKSILNQGLVKFILASNLFLTSTVFANPADDVLYLGYPPGKTKTTKNHQAAKPASVTRWKTAKKAVSAIPTFTALNLYDPLKHIPQIYKMITAKRHNFLVKPTKCFCQTSSKMTGSLLIPQTGDGKYAMLTNKERTFVQISADAVTIALDKVNVQGLAKAKSFYQEDGELVFSSGTEPEPITVATAITPETTDSNNRSTINSLNIFHQDYKNMIASSYLGARMSIIGSEPMQEPVANMTNLTVRLTPNYQVNSVARADNMPVDDNRGLATTSANLSDSIVYLNHVDSYSHGALIVTLREPATNAGTGQSEALIASNANNGLELALGMIAAPATCKPDIQAQKNAMIANQTNATRKKTVTSSHAGTSLLTLGDLMMVFNVIPDKIPSQKTTDKKFIDI